MKFDFVSAALSADFYKLSHRPMYPKNTTKVYSTWTPRSVGRAERYPGLNGVVHFGVQALLKNMNQFFKENFFEIPWPAVREDYKRIVRYTLGVRHPETDHLEALHSLGYLPLSIRTLPEGSVVPARTPVLTVCNSKRHDAFFWLTNYVESLFSAELWQASTSATIANEYRKLFERFAKETGDLDFVPFQGHDFSFRGMSSLGSAINSGMGHLTSFVGTDTIPAIQALEHYYQANVEKELVGTSVPASEHSIQCAYNNDFNYFTRLIRDVHPEGIVSIVSDGYDFWNVIGSVLPELKDLIMARPGKVVIRPDSGDPVKIVCGDPFAKEGGLSRKGAVEALWDLFGGTTNEKGYKVLDPHIGLIYGDAITYERAEQILSQLKEKGFASNNIVFGIGSYTYQYNTRDTLGYAIKSTLAVIDGEERHIFKDPKTDDGVKKSQRGRVVVEQVGNSYVFSDGHALDKVEPNDMLLEVYRDGVIRREENIATIRTRLRNHV